MIDGSNPSTQQQCWARLVSIILWHILYLNNALRCRVEVHRLVIAWLPVQVWLTRKFLS